VFGAQHYIAALLAVALLGCASPGQRDANPLVGRWYGERFQPYLGGDAKWLIDRRSDGTYTVTFRRYQDGRVVQEHRERGRWVYMSGLYATWTQFLGESETDPKDEHFQDMYLIEIIANGEVKYKHIRTGLDFRAQRVADDFQLP
jgi:hypothetical protein